MEILIIIIKIITEQVNLNELSLKLERLLRTFFKYILLTMTIAITIVMNNLSILNLKMMSCLVKISYDSAKISKTYFKQQLPRNVI